MEINSITVKHGNTYDISCPIDGDKIILVELQNLYFIADCVLKSFTARLAISPYSCIKRILYKYNFFINPSIGQDISQVLKCLTFVEFISKMKSQKDIAYCPVGQKTA